MPEEAPKPERPKQPKRYCPKGHVVMTAFNKQRCSVRQCGQDKLAMMGETAASGMALDLDEVAAATPQDLALNHRNVLARVPKGLKGEEAVKWSQDKMVELLPEAVANITWNLRYGTDRQRDEATDRVLRANGMDKKDASATSTSGLIVLNLGSADASVPWLQRMRPSTQQTVEAVTGQKKDGE